MSHAETWIFSPCIPCGFEAEEFAGHSALNLSDTGPKHLRLWDETAELEACNGLEHWLDLNA